MKVHKLKTIQPFFNDVFYNKKEFEVRKNDRDYKVGDRLQLIEHGDNIKQPRYVLKDIKYILPDGQYGIDKDYVVLGLKEVNPISLAMQELRDFSSANPISSEEELKMLSQVKDGARGCL